MNTIYCIWNYYKFVFKSSDEMCVLNWVGNKTVIIIAENYSNIKYFMKNIVIMLIKLRIYS